MEKNSLKPFAGDLDVTPRQNGNQQLTPFAGVLDGEAPASTSFARSVGDSAIALGTGVAQGVKMLSDSAGAGNAVSRLIGKGIKAAENLESDERKAQKQERAQTIKAAEESGSTWEEAKAYAGSFTDAPLDTTLNAVGSAGPTIAASAVTGGFSGVAQVAARVLPMLFGAAQGAGAVKGGIYDAVEQKHIEAGANPDQAAQRADVAQAYSGDNLGSIATGAGLGVLAGSTGAEAAVRRLAGGAAAKHAADKSVKGIAKGAALGVAKEAPLEAVQGGQERLAANLAEQGEGFDTPTMRGVVGQAALEGLAAAPLGGGLGAVEASGRAGRETPVDAANTAVDPSLQASSTAGDGVQAGAQALDQQQAQRMDGDTALPAGAQPEGQALQATQQGQEQAAPAVVQEPSSAQVDPVEDVVQPAVQAAPIAPSAAMGINPEDGPLSAVAAQAVDSGTTDQLNAEAMAQQFAQTSQQQNQPAPAQEGVDAETGEVSEQAREQQILERLDYLGQQGRATGWTQEAVTQRDALQQELDLLNPALRMEQLSSEADAADAEARDWASRNYKPNTKPLPEHAAQGGAADVGEANEQRRIKAIGDAKGRAKAARDEQQAIQDQGNADAALAAKHDTQALRRMKTEEMSTPELQALAAELGPRHVRAKKLEKAIQERAQQSQVAINNGVNKDGGTPLGNNGAQVSEQVEPQNEAAAQQIAREGNASREAGRQRKLEASERWTRMTTVERQAAAEKAQGLNAVAKKNLHTRPWADISEKNRKALLDVVAPKADAASDMQAFAPESGTLGIPRAEMPQVPTQSHGGLVKHLNAQGIAHETTTVDAASLKPTQAEYSPAKVAKAKEVTGDRAVIVSSDGHIIDGHHQAIAAAEDGKAVKAIVLDAPVEQALEAVKKSPSASKVEAPVAVSTENTVRDVAGKEYAALGESLPSKGLAVANVGSDGKVYVGKPNGLHFQVAEKHSDAAGGFVDTGFVTPKGEYLNRQQALAWVEANEKALKPSENMGRSLDAMDYREQVPESKRSAGPVEPVKKPAGRIDDVGEKIGGARKDVWTGFKDDLRAVADDQIKAQPLSKVWPQPDYQKLIDAGASVDTMAMVRALRDAVETKPRVSYKVKHWADQVAVLRGFATDILEGKAEVDAIKAQMRSVQSRGIRNVLGRADLYEAVGHSKSLEGISFEQRHYSLYNGRKDVDLWVIERAAKATAFSNWPRELASADTKEQAIEAFKKTYGQLDQAKEKKSASFDIFSETFTRGYFVGKKLGRTYAKLAGPFPSLKEARAHRDANEVELTKQLQAYKEVPQERGDENRPRVGQDMRNGVDVTPEQFREAFGFRGVEFGNWVEQGKRQQELNQAYDALMDMAAVLQLPAKAISLNGELGLAFGARGGGGSGAAKAHYESGKVVINMTKRAGAGSLGHEWWHALDNYFSRQRKAADGFMTSATDVHASAGGRKAAPGGAGVRPEMVEAFGAVVRAINLTALRERSKALDERRSKDYWSTDVEMSARSFESYLIAKLQDQSASNDYLANVVSPKAWETAAKDGVKLDGTYPYPSIDELPQIREGFDKFFQTVETKDTDQGVAMFRRSDTDTPQDFDVQGFLKTMNEGQPAFSDEARAQAVGKVKGTVDAIRKAWANGPEVVVAFDMADPVIPEAARQADLKQRSGGALGAPEGFYFEGKAYLMASQLKTPNDTARVLFHESLGHHGLRGAFGKELDGILNQIATMRKADVDAKILEYGLRDVNLQDRRIAAEEVLAEMAQSTPEIGFVKRAVAAIRSWLRTNVPGFQSLKLTDAEIINNYLLPARAWVENGGSEQGAQLGGLNLSPAMSRSAMKSVEANIARGEESLAAALNDKTTVHRAMFRNGLGWVDFVWGAEGEVKPNGKTKGAMGLSHILEARQRKDGLSEQEAIKSLSKVVTAIASGKEVARNSFRDSVSVKVEHAGYRVALTKNPGSNAWVVTAFDLSQVHEGSGIDTPSSMQSISTLTRDGLGADSVATGDTVPSLDRATHRDSTKRGSPTGADDSNSLAADGRGGNTMFSRSKLADLKDKGMKLAHDALTHPGKVSLWDRSVGTMRHVSERYPAFKPVFEAAQQFIDDVSSVANQAAQVAPRLIPRVETLGDMVGKNRKRAISVGDNQAIGKALFGGTLDWGRDQHGKAMPMDALRDKYRGLTVDQKAEVLLAAKKITPQMMGAFRAKKLDQFETIINDKFESTILKAGAAFSHKELKEFFNLNEQQISLYDEARATVDKSLDITARAEMLRTLGRDWDGMRDIVMDAPTLTEAWKLLDDELEHRAKQYPDTRDRLAAQMHQLSTTLSKAQELMDHGYMPLQRFGKYTLDVLDQNGERLYYGMFESKTDSHKMRQVMEREFPGAKITQGTMNEHKHKLMAGITPETAELFGSMLGLDAEGNQEKDKAFQEYLKLAKNNHSAMKRLIHRKGILGYSDDVGRVLASFVYSNARVSATGLNAGKMETAINDLNTKHKEEGELGEIAAKLRSYIQDPQEEGQAIRGMLFAQYLGGSLASAAVNMTQPFAVTLPWLSQYGGMAKASKYMSGALRDMVKRGNKYEPDLAHALRMAEDDGVVSPQEIHQLMAQSRGAGGLRSGDGTKLGDARAAASNAWEKGKVAWGQPFALAEQFNRRSTFIAAYRLARDRGMDSPAQFARDAVVETQFLYTKANKPQWARGAIGGTLFTFKTYSVSFLELMHRTWNAGEAGSPERAAGRRAVGWAMLMLMLMGGAGGMPFVEDVEDLVDGAGQMMGYNLSSKQWRKDLMREVLGAELAEFMDSGLSGMPGAPIDVSGRLGMGNLIPGTGLVLNKQSNTRDMVEMIGPAGDLVSRVFSGAGDLAGGFFTGDAARMGRGAMEAMPTAVRNLQKGADMAASGMYKDGKGYKVVDTTLDEALWKAIGFQPRTVAEVQESNSFILRSKSFYTQTSNDIRAQWAKALFEKDDAAVVRVRERLARWNEQNPDQPIRINMPDIWKRAGNMGKDRTARIADTAPTAIRQQMREFAARE